MQPSFVEDVFSFDNDYESSASVSRSRSPSPKSRRVHYSVAPVPIRVHREASPAPVGSGSPTPLPLDERDAQTRRWIHTQFRPSQPLYDEYEDSFNTPTKSVFDSDTEDEVDEDELLSDEEDVEDDCSSTSSSSSSDDSDSEAIYMQPSNRTSFTSLFPQPPTTIPVVVPIRRPSPVRSLASSQYRLRACASGGLRPLTPASAAPALLCPSRAAGSLVDTSSAVATPTFDTDEDLPALAHSESTASSSSSSSASSDDEERSVPIPIYISCPTSRGRRAKPGYDAYEDIHSPPHAARKERQMFRSNSWMHDWAMRPESYATRR